MNLAVQQDADPETQTEAQTIALGREIFARARDADSSQTWLDRKVMEAGMADERVKAQLFRLVDVLPVLTNPQSVNRHLREYLSQVADRLPWAARESLEFFPKNGLFAHLLSKITLTSTRRMARRFIAASDAHEAIAAVKALRARRMTFTID